MTAVNVGGNHWCLAVSKINAVFCQCFTTNLCYWLTRINKQEQEVFYLDSLGGSGHTTHMNVLRWATHVGRLNAIIYAIHHLLIQEDCASLHLKAPSRRWSPVTSWVENNSIYSDIPVWNNNDVYKFILLSISMTGLLHTAIWKWLWRLHSYGKIVYMLLTKVHNFLHLIVWFVQDVWSCSWLHNCKRTWISTVSHYHTCTLQDDMWQIYDGGWD